MSHIDNYISPVSWTDSDMDWENPNSQQACYMDALLSAVQERYYAANDVNANMWRYTRKPAPDRQFSYYTLMLLHYYMMNLIPLFIDLDEEPISIATGKIKETYNGIEYQYDYNYGNVFSTRKSMSVTEQYKCFNFLTVEKVAEKLGVSEIVYPQNYVRDNSAWLKQSYNILNMMKVTVQETGRISYAPVKAYKRTRTKYTDYETPASSYDTTSDWIQYGGYSVPVYSSVTTMLRSRDPITLRSVTQTQDQLKMSAGFYFPSSWKALGYIHKYMPYSDYGYYLYFISNEVPNAGYYYTEISDNFKEGFGLIDLEAGDLNSLIEQPILDSPYDGVGRSNNIVYPFFLIEHDFKFKSGE